MSAVVRFVMEVSTESGRSTVESFDSHFEAMSGPAKTACGASCGGRSTLHPHPAEGFRFVINAQCPLRFCVKNRLQDSLPFMTGMVCAQVTSKANAEDNNHLFLDKSSLVDWHSESRNKYIFRAKPSEPLNKLSSARSGCFPSLWHTPVRSMCSRSFRPMVSCCVDLFTDVSL